MGFTPLATDEQAPESQGQGFKPLEPEAPQDTLLPHVDKLLGVERKPGVTPTGMGITPGEALGLLEQPGAGLYGMFQQAVGGTRALFKASIAKAAGLSFPEIFQEELKKGIDSTPEYVHITPQGKQMAEALSNALGEGIKAYGELGYKLGRIPTSPLDPVLPAVAPAGSLLPSPAAGAMSETIASLGLMAAPLGGGPKATTARAQRPVDVIKAFEDKYPHTAAAIDASQVGKVKYEPTELVTDSISKALDAELGPGFEALSIGDKVKSVIDKYGKDMPVSDKIRYANAYVDYFRQAQAAQEALIASIPKLPAPVEKGFKPLEGEVLPPEVITGYDLRNNKLPAPGKSTGDTITVDSQGTAMTGQNRRIQQSAFDHEADRLMKWIAEGEKISGKPFIPKKQRGMIDIDGLDEALYANNAAALAALSHGVVMPLKAFHGTTADFPPGTYSDGHGIGPHFGSLAQAEQFTGLPNAAGQANPGPMGKQLVNGGSQTAIHIGQMKVMGKIPGSLTDPNVVPSGNIRPVDLYFKKPGRTRDLSWENPGRLVEQLSDPNYTNGKPLLTTQQQYRIKLDAKKRNEDSILPMEEDAVNYGLPDVVSGAAQAKSLRQAMYDDIKAALRENGYDAIVYENIAEGRVGASFGGWINDSYISLDPVNQVKLRGTNEKGMVEIEGLDANIPKAGEAVKEAAGKAWAVPNPQEANKIAERAIANNYKAMEDKKKVLSTNTLKQIRRGVVSHDYDLQVGLKEAGIIGERAMLQMNVQHNATMVAKSRYDKSGRAIFDDLSPKDLRGVEEITRLRRIIQIDKYKGVGTIRHEVDPVTKTQLNGPIAAARLDALKAADPAKFAKLDAKATAIFTEEKVNLKRLLDEDIIDQATYDKMKNLDYSRTEYLDIVDPEVPIKSNIRGFPTSIRSSGIPLLGRGKSAAVNMDAKLLLQEDIARVENRIARNRVLQSLYDLAETPNDVVMRSNAKSISKDGEVKAVPEGWTSLGVRIDGKQKNVLMRDDFAQQFVTRPDAGLNTVMFSIGDLDVTLGAILRTASGSSLLRATATKYNPAFILAGLPMDILHLWLAQSRTYSPHLPVYAVQIGRDLAATAKDAFFRTGRWNDAMLEGMGPNFLTHETRASVVNPAIIEPKMQKLRTAMAYLGDFQDMWVRLAHRERLMREGMDGPTATATAVERLNYYRGGVLTKFVDSMIPYTNIAVNATSKVIETAAKDKGAAFSKVAWLTAGLSAAKLAGMIAAPETDKAISVEDKVRNVILPFGDTAYVMDADGNKRYMYATIRLDQTAMPFNAAVVAGLENAEYGTVPSGIATKAMGQVNPLSTMFPPMWQAYRAYTDNYDPLRDSPIYRGLKVKPEDEIRNVSRGQPTGQMAQLVGGMTGLSPMGLEKAAGALVNSNNFYIQAASGLSKLVQGERDPREQANETIYMLQNVPGLRQVVKLTTPGIEQMKSLDKISREVNSQYKQHIDALETKLFQVEQGQLPMKSVEDYIKSAPANIQKSLANHAKYEYQVNKILKDAKASDGIPPKNWWTSSNQLRDETRAHVFYNEWVSAGMEERRRMLDVAGKLQNAGTGYMSDSFRREFAKQRQLLGDEKR